MNYKKFIQHRCLLFGTFSASKAARKITRKLEPSNIARYGSNLYEQAYNYYMITRKRYYGFWILFAVVIILAILNFVFLDKAIWLSAALTTLFMYWMRGDYRCE